MYVAYVWIVHDSLLLATLSLNTGCHFCHSFLSGSFILTWGGRNFTLSLLSRVLHQKRTLSVVKPVVLDHKNHSHRLSGRLMVLSCWNTSYPHLRALECDLRHNFVSNSLVHVSDSAFRTLNFCSALPWHQGVNCILKTWHELRQNSFVAGVIVCMTGRISLTLLRSLGETLLFTSEARKG